MGPEVKGGLMAPASLYFVIPDKRAPSARRSGIHSHRIAFGEDSE